MTDVSALLIGLIVATYWGRVLRMASRAKEIAGHSANIIPREPIGVLTRLVWFPVVSFWIGLPIYRGLGRSFPWLMRPLFAWPQLGWCAVVAALAAFVMTWICWKTMGKSWRMGIDPGEKTELISTGPYAHVRHPIYALSMMLMLATVAAVPTPLMIIVAVVHITLLHMEAHREEAYLARTHGINYQRYAEKVRRFIPRWMPPRLANGWGGRPESPDHRDVWQKG